MLEKLTNWLKVRVSSKKPVAATGPHETASSPAAAPALEKRTKSRIAPEFVDTDYGPAHRIESNGPGKNVLVRRNSRRGDTGTDETLSLLDDSPDGSGEESGLDPYNTGGFDRSKNWDRRFTR